MRLAYHNMRPTPEEFLVDPEGKHIPKIINKNVLIIDFVP